MLIEAARSCLVVVDIQERLAPAMFSLPPLIRNANILLRTAELLEVPVLASEQYRKGLGPTLLEVAELLPEGAILEKSSFSCMADAAFAARLQELGRPQTVVIGMEAHVCVLQTCMHLLESGREVFVVEDAVSSRTPENHRAALTRLAREGARVVTTEMVAFEWLERADIPAFKEVSRMVK